MQSRPLWLFAPLLLLVAVALATEDAALTHLLDPAAERMPMHTVVPIYPKRALQDRLQGDVEVCFDVDREGRTSRVAVRRSSHRIFEKPAIQAIKASSYKPLPAEKVMTGVKTCRTFRFRLDPVAIEDPSEFLGDAEP